MKGYPGISISYMRSFTDCTGIIQHAVHGVPNRRLGYTTDDNARALAAVAQYYDLTRDPQALELALIYLSFIHHAQTPDQRFRNVMTYQRDFLDDEGTEDCYGRTIWGSGSAASSTLPENVRIVAKKLFDDSIGWVGDLTSPRAKAYSVLGMRQYLQANSDEADLQDKMEVLSDSLISGFQLYSGSDWQWFEPYLTYGNAILPLALLTAAQVTGNSKYERIARRTMDFLTDVVVVDGRLEIIGNNGWYMRGGKRAWYDQQSVDAGYLICLYCAAYEHFTDRCYLDLAHTAYDWYFGRNRTGLSVYDPISGGCFDAVIEQGVNLNQGAESCVCFLLAQLAIERHLPRKVKR